MIGPYRESADETNRLMTWNVFVRSNSDKTAGTHLAEFIGTVQHGISCSPSHIAVEGNLEWYGNTTLLLDALKVLDPDGRCLNLQCRSLAIQRRS